MIYLGAFLCGLLAGAALGFGTGLTAATTYSKLGGSNSGGSEMAGFFYVGPFGLVAGFLLAAGAVLLYSGGMGVGKGLMWAGLVVLGLGAIVFAYPLVANEERGQQSKFNLELEFELAKCEVADYTELEKFCWGYAGESTDESANSPFYESNCADEHCYLRAAIQMLDYPSRRLAIFGRGEKLEKFSIPFVGVVNRATEWAEWQPREQVRFRWRMKSAR